jgi:hypothetical protein
MLQNNVAFTYKSREKIEILGMQYYLHANDR